MRPVVPRAHWGGLASPSPTDADIAILGLPYDGGVGWRPGAAEAPSRLREISSSSPAISEDGYVVDPRRLRLRDLGDVVPEGSPEHYFGRVQAVVESVLAVRPRPFLLSIGGDHSVLIPLFRGFCTAASGPVGLVLLDAHPDLFDVYHGFPLSHACPVRRCLETGRLPPERLLILGTRSYNAEELDFIHEQGIRFVPARDVDRGGVPAILNLARKTMAGLASVYLTVDIDVADPSCAPGTGAPVAGGLSSRQLLDLCRGLLETLPVQAMDIVEVSPPLDRSDITLFLALQVVFETFAVLARKTG
jgi:agmatinase